MKALILFPFQLHISYISSSNITKDDKIYILETQEQMNRYAYHKNRLVLHMSATRHFINDVKSLDYDISLLSSETVNDALKPLSNIIMFKPTDDSDIALINDIPSINFYNDPLFIVSNDEWQVLLNKKPWKMDTIYRKLRLKHHILMEQDKPIGGKYSYDSSNRKPYKKGISFHEPLMFQPDEITLSCIDFVNRHYPNNPGNTSQFLYPVNRQEALDALDHFVYYRLPSFGDYQDVMIENMPWMSHSLLSSSINLGLLSPMEVIQAALKSFSEGLSEIEPVEGFIRQILGWREYVRGIYLMTPNYEQKNALNHTFDLPSFYWDAKTDLNCIHQTVSETIKYGYNHHIQRLMVLSNFANLIKVSPKHLRDWFNTMYIDSFDWIVAPNVIGMGLYADGGMMSTKPYVSSGAYIKKMSNYCDTCIYDPNMKTGPKACPFHSLYWAFIKDHEDILKSNPRMSMMYHLLDKMDENTKQAYMQAMHTFIARLNI